MTIGQKIPTVPPEYSKEELAKRKELRRFEKIDLFIFTNFKRKCEPIHVLAVMEGWRHIKIDKEELIFKNDAEVFKTIGTIAKEHYQNSGGKIELWGRIISYIYTHTDGKKYIFSPDGVLQKDSTDTIDGQATLNINGKQIPSSFFASNG